MSNVTKDKVSQSTRIRDFLDSAPADYSFTVAELTKDLRAKQLEVSNGAVSGFISKLAEKGFLAKTRTSENTAYMFRVKRPISGYSTRAGSVATPKSTGARSTTKAAVIKPAKTVVKSNQQIVDEILNLLAQLSSNAPDLSKVSREQLLTEMLRRETAN